MTITAKFRVVREDFKLDVDLRVPGQGVTAVFGPSGCGKTTLLRAIAGLEHHQRGELQFGDAVWQDDEHFTAPHERPVGYVFQEASLFSHLTVRRNLTYGLKRVRRTERKISLERAIELLDIGALLKRKPDALSGGEKQRVAIARALAVSPRLLLMDEPLASLDLNRKQEILPYIESLQRDLQIPVIYVSHLPDEVARLADHLVLMDNGSVVAAGAINDMLTRLDLSLAHDNEAGAIIDAVVAGHDDNYHLTHLDSAAGRFTVIHKDLPIGSPARLRIAARDISLTLAPQTDTSILNIFPARVDELAREGQAQMTVKLLVGGVPMLARVTRKSATMLDLQPGKELFAQAKSVALLS